MKLSEVAPLYARIAAVLRQRIETGALDVGAMMPTLESYMSEFAASRVTVRQAMDMLAEEGLIARRRGFGTTVLAQPRTTRDVSLPMTWHELLTRLDDVKRTKFSVSFDDSPSAESLNRDEKSTANPASKPRRKKTLRTPRKFAHLKALHHHGNSAYCLVDAWMARDIYDASANALRTRPALSVLMKSHAAQVCKVSQTLTLGIADLDVASALDIPLGSPIALVRRTVFNEDGDAIYAAQIYFPAGVVRIDTLLFER
jgi:GntR family transcriptional regulator